MEWDEGKGWAADPGSKASSSAARLMGVLFADYAVERLRRVSATVALPGVATVAWPPCLGAGAVAQGAGGTNCTKAVEVCSGFCCFLAFAASPPCGGYICRGPGVTHPDRALHEKGGFWMTSGVCNNVGAARCAKSIQQPLIFMVGL